jgi:hypothetical protein
MRYIFLTIIAFCTFVQTQAQNKWFSTYKDSTALTTDANKITQQLADRIIKVKPDINLHDDIAIKNTTPNLIFFNYKNKTLNLPFWTEVIPPQQQFFAEVAGGEKEGREVFGLFFNGFYIAHELGHSFFNKTGKDFDNKYDSEYEANTFAILYWKATGEKDNLKKCYNYAVKMLRTLKNPVPENEDFKKYLTENYGKLASDPYKYGYIQFSQFVEIYDNEDLPDFDTYIKKN